MIGDALGERDAAVWLFGSCTRGDPRQDSDIDTTPDFREHSA
jgi:predicted nucleotidyltransferase